MAKRREKVSKAWALQTLAVAQHHLLTSTQGLRPDDVHRRLSEDTNTIAWILGHCTNQLDNRFVGVHRQRLLPEDFRARFDFGASKEAARQVDAVPFATIVDWYVELVASV